MTCDFCNNPGQNRGDEVCVCASCWALLQDPKTALPLIRGTVTMKLRGTLPKAELDRMVNEFMGRISEWKRPG
jgi:hypothetical protein